MFCPECGCEYREGFYECADCGVALTYEPPQADPPLEKGEFVTVLETSDPALISVVKSILEGSNIWYSELKVKQCPAFFQVEWRTTLLHFKSLREDEEKARELLREFEYQMWEGPIEP